MNSAVISGWAWLWALLGYLFPSNLQKHFWLFTVFPHKVKCHTVLTDILLYNWIFGTVYISTHPPECETDVVGVLSGERWEGGLITPQYAHFFPTHTHTTPLEPVRIITQGLSGKDVPTCAAEDNVHFSSSYCHALALANVYDCRLPPAHLSFKKTFFFQNNRNTRHASAILHSVWSRLPKLPGFHPISAYVPWSPLFPFRWLMPLCVRSAWVA